MNRETIDPRIELACDLLNDFGGPTGLSVRTANAMAFRGGIKRWQDALGIDWRSRKVRGIGKAGLAEIKRAQDYHQKLRSERSTPDYILAMCDAVRYHDPCKNLDMQLMNTLMRLHEQGIRKPNDWIFHYNGQVELRWHNGDENRFSSAKGWVGLTIWSDKIGIRGRTGNKPGYGDEGKLDVDALPPQEAMQLAVVLIRMIDRGREQEGAK